MKNSTNLDVSGAVSRALLWGLISLATLALAGLVLNLVIARAYGPEALGTFNICLALFIVASQLGSFGIHYSILESVSSSFGRRPRRTDLAVISGGAATLLIATAIALLALPLALLLPSVFPDAENIQIAWLLLIPGLWAIPLNKFLMNVTNAARHMRDLALLNSFRFLMVLAALAFIYFNDWPAYSLTLTLSVSELLLLPLAMFSARRVVSSNRRLSRPWVRRHILFGSRAFLAGAVAELNTRVDVLCLGILMDTRTVGLYSVALLIVEGFGQFLVVLRTIVNPYLARFFQDGELDRLSRFVRKVNLLTIPAFLLFTATAMVIFPYFVSTLLGDDSFLEATTPLALLLVLQALASGMLSVNMVLSMTGAPALQTLYNGGTLAFNFALNLAFIPALGMHGAALATGISYIAGSMLLLYLFRRRTSHWLV
jgi:O-antigen/teichoic acid export membrane protein